MLLIETSELFVDQNCTTIQSFLDSKITAAYPKLTVRHWLWCYALTGTEGWKSDVLLCNTAFSRSMKLEIVQRLKATAVHLGLMVVTNPRPTQNCRIPRVQLTNTAVQQFTAEELQLTVQRLRLLTGFETAAQRLREDETRVNCRKDQERAQSTTQPALSHQSTNTYPKEYHSAVASMLLLSPEEAVLRLTTPLPQRQAQEPKSMTNVQAAELMSQVDKENKEKRNRFKSTTSQKKTGNQLADEFFGQFWASAEWYVQEGPWNEHNPATKVKLQSATKVANQDRVNMQVTTLPDARLLVIPQDFIFGTPAEASEHPYTLDNANKHQHKRQKLLTALNPGPKRLSTSSPNWQIETRQSLSRASTTPLTVLPPLQDVLSDEEDATPPLSQLVSTATTTTTTTTTNKQAPKQPNWPDFDPNLLPTAPQPKSK
eukprot:TRINITY_DN60646_c0_g1_i1.p1 TRINITY_DN60646_c0_g1~~TRINITY_DN60646_c0_g1_i1.p1  ORF type:complete len:429 (-),score=64.48 TRINITY_DN60646_c0_g1_i1:30-1316(-)